jgi:hypothetical protein
LAVDFEDDGGGVTSFLGGPVDTNQMKRKLSSDSSGSSKSQKLSHTKEEGLRVYDVKLIKRALKIPPKTVAYIDAQIVDSDELVHDQVHEIVRHPSFRSNIFFIPLKQKKKISGDGTVKMSVRNRSDESQELPCGMIVGQITVNIPEGEECRPEVLEMDSDVPKVTNLVWIHGQKVEVESKVKVKPVEKSKSIDKKIKKQATPPPKKLATPPPKKLVTPPPSSSKSTPKLMEPQAGGSRDFRERTPIASDIEPTKTDKEKMYELMLKNRVTDKIEAIKEAPKTDKLTMYELIPIPPHKFIHCEFVCFWSFFYSFYFVSYSILQHQLIHFLFIGFGWFYIRSYGSSFTEIS